MQKIEWSANSGDRTYKEGVGGSSPSAPTRNAPRVAIAGAAGQPHKGYPDAGHFIQEDAGPELAADIAEWIRASPRSPARREGADQ